MAKMNWTRQSKENNMRRWGTVDVEEQPQQKPHRKYWQQSDAGIQSGVIRPWQQTKRWPAPVTTTVSKKITRETRDRALAMIRANREKNDE